jgi:hypothetical protein
MLLETGTIISSFIFIVITPLFLEIKQVSAAVLNIGLS